MITQRFVSTLAITLALLLGVAAPALAREDASTGSASAVGLVWFAGTPRGGNAVAGSSATLITDRGGAAMSLHTSGLEPGSTVTVWWVVFNHPERCANGHDGLRCGAGDLRAAAVDGSVLWATGAVIRDDGGADFRGYLSTAKTAGALFGPGLVNPLGADVHLVVRSHGPALPEFLYAQLYSFGGGCKNAPPKTGPNTCQDLQYAAFEQ